MHARIDARGRIAFSFGKNAISFFARKNFRVVAARRRRR
jgi:hypothetical protein